MSAADQDQIQSVEGVSTALAARIKAETDDIEVSDEVDADVEEKKKENSATDTTERISEENRLCTLDFCRR
ncbi:hypothetical protein ACFQHN_22425 [Natrialbaceae archaeon GCM10025896]